MPRSPYLSRAARLDGGHPVRHLLLLIPFALIVAGCSTFLPGDPTAYAKNIPAGCTEKMLEIESLGGDVLAIRTTRAVKDVAVEITPVLPLLFASVPVAVGFIGPIIKAVRLDDATRQKRIDFLVERYFEQGCTPL